MLYFINNVLVTPFIDNCNVYQKDGSLIIVVEQFYASFCHKFLSSNCTTNLVFNTCFGKMSFQYAYEKTSFFWAFYVDQL